MEQYVRPAPKLIERRLEPEGWYNPPLFKYVLLGEDITLYAVGKAAGWYTSAGDFGAQHKYDPSVLYRMGRATSALLGALTVLVAYGLGSAGWNRRVGLMAAWFLAVCLLHVRESHYAVSCSAATLATTAGLLCCVKIVRCGHLKWYRVAGVLLGLGFATKYTAMILVIPVLVAHGLSPGVHVKGMIRLQVRRITEAAGWALGAAVIASPYFLLTPNEFVYGLYQNYVFGRDGLGGWQFDPAGGYAFYAKSLVWGLGWPLLLLVSCAIIKGAWRHSATELVVLSLPVTMFAFMGSQKVYLLRYLLPAVPALLVIAAAWLDYALDVMGVSATSTRDWLIRVAAAVLVGVASVTASVRLDYLLTQRDTRSLAKEWIEKSIPDGARIALEFPFLCPALSTPTKPMPQSTRSYEVMEVRGWGLAEHSLQFYARHGFRYLISSSMVSGLPFRDRGNEARRRAFYASLDRELELVAVFRPTGGEEELPVVVDELYGPALSLWERKRPGPTIKVYRLPK
jgi:hypothetical protein